jgi:hypothetical protein
LRGVCLEGDYVTDLVRGGGRDIRRGNIKLSF